MPDRRENLKKQKHFLVRGTGWLSAAKIPVSRLSESDHRRTVFGGLPARGLHWQTFCEEWRYERGEEDSLGRNNISKYLANNSKANYLTNSEQETRFFTLYRGIGFIAFLDQFATEWFNDASLGAERRTWFAEYFHTDYYDHFVFDVMRIQPFIYKIGLLGDPYNHQLMGAAWHHEPSGDRAKLKVADEQYLREFRREIDLPWPDDDSVAVETVVKALFVDELCSDFDFISRVAEFSGSFYGTAAPFVRAGKNFKGPVAGILPQRFVDISAPLSGPAG